MKIYLFNCEGDKHYIQAPNEYEAKKCLKEKCGESWYNWMKVVSPENVAIKRVVCAS